MSQHNAEVVRSLESSDVKADKVPQAPPAYSSPQLVVLGQALELVQGSDLYKMVVDANRRGYHD